MRWMHWPARITAVLCVAVLGGAPLAALAATPVEPGATTTGSTDAASAAADPSADPSPPPDTSGQSVTIVLPVESPKSRPSKAKTKAEPKPTTTARTPTRAAVIPRRRVVPTAPRRQVPASRPRLVAAHGGRSARVAVPAARGGLSAPTRAKRQRHPAADASAAAQAASAPSGKERVPRWLFEVVGLLALVEVLFLTRLAFRRRLGGRSRGKLPGTSGITVSPGVKKEASFALHRSKRHWRKVVRKEP